jgi:predicted acyltransferase
MSQTTVAAAKEQPPASGSRRLLSLDAFRGFDMFWIVGGEELVHALYTAWPIGATRTLHEQMEHKDWGGVHFYDMIFPWFVFIVGVSLVFSLTRLIEQVGKAAALKRILFRTVVLYLFGLLIYGGISKGIDHVRWLGVLQRIAICYGAAGLIFCFFRLRGMIAICAGLLIGYCALTSLVPIRDFNVSKSSLAQQGLTPDEPKTRSLFLQTTNEVRRSFEDGKTLPQHIDFMYLPGYKWDGAYDPEGMLSTLPAIANCLLGVFVGMLLRNGKQSDSTKVKYLIGCGIASILLGFLWGLQFPVIKKIWTSSYVLVVCGYGAVVLGMFYQIIEIWGWRRWCTPFVWVGTNAITIYMVFHLVSFRKLAEMLVGGPVEAAFGAFGDLLVAAVIVGLMLGLVRFLHTRKLFLRL